MNCVNLPFLLMPSRPRFRFRKWLGSLIAGICLVLVMILMTGCKDLKAQKPVANPAAYVSSLVVTPDAGLLLMLVPNEQLLDDPQLTAWVDAASEEGVRLQPVTDKQFKSLGARALEFAGLVLPDGLHRVVANDVVNAIITYTVEGGRTMLVYDFAALKLDDLDRPVYYERKSRMSELAGIDYLLYDDLGDKTTELGRLVALPASLRAMMVPPGKSMLQSDAVVPHAFVSPVLGKVAVDYLMKNPAAVPRRPVTDASDVRAVTGYLLGPLTYPRYATRGRYRGTVLATSDQQELIAGVHQAGRGKLMFVNMPVTDLKLRTDGLPMHGFLRYFVDHVAHMARLSPMPDGVAGLTLNWHLDYLAAQEPLLALEKLGIFNDGPFSIDLTAGPDVNVVGDGIGWDLDHNSVAQNVLRRLDARGHSIGNHGGWAHNIYGDGANESNQATFQPFLEWNQTSLEKVMGKPARSYSSPVGNNPLWAMDWLERQGVVSAYFGGHSGLGPTRHYRDGKLRNPKMWIFPVTPQGLHAVFEEFDYFRLPKAEVLQWYHNLIDFAIEKNTTRLIYMHPPYAIQWKDVVQDLLSYAKAKGPERFRWYTMERLADFMTTRLDVKWTESTDANGSRRFSATHPVTLKEMVWILPKSKYPVRPTLVSGQGIVTDDGLTWQVKAGNIAAIEFSAALQ